MKSRVFAVFAAFVFTFAALVVFAAGNNPPTQKQMNTFTAMVDVEWITRENFQVFLDGIQMSRKLQREINKVVSGLSVVSVTVHYIWPANASPNTETMTLDIVFAYNGEKNAMFDKLVAVTTASETEMMNEAMKILARDIVEQIKTSSTKKGDLK